MSNAYLYRMPSGIAGDISRKSQSTAEPSILGATPFPSFGVFAKLVNGVAVPLDGTDSNDAKVYGLLVRQYPTNASNDGLGTSTPPTTGICDIMRSGYMTVQLNAGVAVKGGAVYVRIDTPTTGKPVGGIEAVADGAHTILITKATFMDAGDASGNVEIAYNI